VPAKTSPRPPLWIRKARQAVAKSAAKATAAALASGANVASAGPEFFHSYALN